MSAERGQSYLTFYLNENLYACDAEVIATTIEQPVIFEFPGMPACIAGCTVYQDCYIPVLHMKVTCAFSNTLYSGDPAVIVVRDDSCLFGLLVDCVGVPVDLQSDQEATDSCSGQIRTKEYVQKLVPFGDQMVPLILAKYFVEYIRTNVYVSGDNSMVLNRGHSAERQYLTFLANGIKFALPISVVIETIKIPSSDIHYAQGSSCIEGMVNDKGERFAAINIARFFNANTLRSQGDVWYGIVCRSNEKAAIILCATVCDIWAVPEDVEEKPVTHMQLLYPAVVRSVEHDSQYAFVVDFDALMDAVT